MSAGDEQLAAVVAELGALPVPVGPEPQASERDRLQAAFVAALDTAHKTQPCSCGSEIWSSCCHPGARRHSERRADAVLAVRDAEVEFLLGEADRLQLRVDEVERAYTFDTAELKRRIAELEAERHVTNEALDDAVQALRERQAEREALVERLRAGQTWQRGRTPELVSENYVSQSELREIFGIPLVAPWGDGITQQIAPVQSLREDESVEAGER